MEARRKSAVLLKNRTWMLGILVLCFVVPCAADDTATVYVEPAICSINLGDTVEVGIMVEGDGIDFRGYVISFHFDPGIVEFLYPAIEGSLFANVPDTMWTWFEPGIVESVGRWEVWDTVMPGGTYVTTPGELFRIRFRALGEGISEVGLVEVWLYDPVTGTDPIEPLKVEHGHICVGDQSGIIHGDPGGFSLGSPFPNPTTGATYLPLLFGPGGRDVGEATVGIYDVLGRLVAVVDQPCSGDVSCLMWDGCDSSGSEIGPGTYFFKLQRQGKPVTRRVIRVR
ncbi:MAG: hypothetical protein ABIJ00_12610 [Candidatus Eisenbacteria bacterium]